MTIKQFHRSICERKVVELFAMTKKSPSQATCVSGAVRFYRFLCIFCPLTLVMLHQGLGVEYVAPYLGRMNDNRKVPVMKTQPKTDLGWWTVDST